MPSTRFFATYSDLEAALSVVEAKRELKYIPFDETANPPVYYSIRDIPAEIFDENNYLITERNTPTLVLPQKYSPAETEPAYEVEVEKGMPSLFFGTCTLADERFIVSGSVETIDDLKYTFEEYAFYREFALALQQHLEQKGCEHLSMAYFYGTEAIALGKAGRDYYLEVPATSIIPYSAWTEESREEEQLMRQQFPVRSARISANETWSYLNTRGYGWLPDDEEDKPSNVLDFFRTNIYDEAFDHLTLPRSSFTRTLIEFTSFGHTDLSGSAFNESDVTDCDFSDADLSQADLRFSLYYFCSFADANLCETDLRGTNIAQCDFRGAQMQGTLLTHEQETQIMLSEEQRAVVEWRDDTGEYED